MVFQKALVFPWPVPDFLQWDPVSYSTPAPDPNRRALAPGWVVDLARTAVVQQRMPVVLLPDVALGGLVWGARSGTRPWPRNWRQRLAEGLLAVGPPVGPRGPGLQRDAQTGQYRFVTPEPSEWSRGEADCPPRCPLHGRPGAGIHRHFRLYFNLLGEGRMRAFEPAFGEKAVRLLADDRADGSLFDFSNPKLTKAGAADRLTVIREMLARHDRAVAQGACPPDEVWEDEVTGEWFLRADLEYDLDHVRPGQPRVPGLFACYLPARVFGPSPRVGLTQRQCHLLSALVGETTRAGGKSERPDKALVVRVSADADAPRPSVPLPPGLAAGEYVAFNGSGWGKKIGLRGYGFKLGTWAEKAGFPDTTVKDLLADLRALSGPFGLTVAGWSSSDQAWTGLDDLQALARRKAGRDWLSGCVLRVYTGADFLVRWRRYFADKLGFKWLPGGEGEPPDAPAESAGIHSPQELILLMRKKGIPDADLAKRMGCHRSQFNQVENGKRKWSPDFDRKVNAALLRLRGT